MTALIRRLNKRLCHPDGTRRLGAMSRVAEYLDVPHSTVIAWIRGATPTKGNREAITKMLTDGKLELTRKKTGPTKGAKTWRFNGNREHVWSGK